MKEYDSWINRTVFLHQVRGPDIAIELNRLNAIQGIDVKATQIFPNGTNPECGNLYDCFIYLKDKFSGVNLP